MDQQTRPKRSAAARTATLALLGAILPCSCAVPPEAEPEQVQLSEATLIEAYETPRQVVADVVVVRTTANFFASTRALDAALEDPSKVRSVEDLGRVPVTLPAVGAMHERTIEPGEDGATTYRYRSLPLPRGSHQPPPPIRMRVGEVDLYAFKSLTVHVLGGRQSLTLDTEARSLGRAPVVVAEGGEKKMECAAVKISGGRWATESSAGAGGRPR